MCPRGRRGRVKVSEGGGLAGREEVDVNKHTILKQHTRKRSNRRRATTRIKKEAPVTFWVFGGLQGGGKSWMTSENGEESTRKNEKNSTSDQKKKLKGSKGRFSGSKRCEQQFIMVFKGWGGGMEGR